MPKVELKVEQLRSYARVMRDVDLRDEANMALKAASVFLKGELRDATPHGATGVGINSWTHRLEVHGNQPEGIIENIAPHVNVINRGDDAGPWRRMPPWSDPASGLQLWFRRRHGLSAKAARSAAFLTARRILRRGFTDAHKHFAEKTFAANRGKVYAIMDDILVRVLKVLQ